jgi:hypothetical protein
MMGSLIDSASRLHRDEAFASRHTSLVNGDYASMTESNLSSLFSRLQNQIDEVLQIMKCKFGTQIVS